MAEHALFQLGMDLEDPSTAQADTPNGEYVAGLDDERQDFFIVKDGVTCAGTHLIIDLHGAEGLDDIGLVDRALRKCVDEAFRPDRVEVDRLLRGQGA